MSKNSKITKDERAFGQLLKIWRTRNKRTFREVAGALGISVTYLYDIETGRRPAPPFATSQLITLEPLLNTDRTDIALALARSRGKVELTFPIGRSVMDDIRIAVAALLHARWENLSVSSIDRIAKILENDR